MPLTTLLTLIALLALFFYLGKMLLPMRDLLLVAGAAGSIGFMLAGIFHGWAMLVGLLFLVAVSFYLGFVFRHPEGGEIVKRFNIFLQVRAQTAFLMGIALIVFVVFVMNQNRRNVNALSEFIAIYEPHTSIESVPRVNKETIGNWILKTGDSAEQVLDFYAQLAARKEWAVSSYSPPQFLGINPPSRRLTFMAQDSDSEDTVVIITLSRPPSPQAP